MKYIRIAGRLVRVNPSTGGKVFFLFVQQENGEWHHAGNFDHDDGPDGATHQALDLSRNLSTKHRRPAVAIVHMKLDAVVRSGLGVNKGIAAAIISGNAYHAGRGMLNV